MPHLLFISSLRLSQVYGKKLIVSLPANIHLSLQDNIYSAAEEPNTGRLLLCRPQSTKRKGLHPARYGTDPRNHTYRQCAGAKCPSGLLQRPSPSKSFFTSFQLCDNAEVTQANVACTSRNKVSSPTPVWPLLCEEYSHRNRKGLAVLGSDMAVKQTEVPPQHQHWSETASNTSMQDLS